MTGTARTDTRSASFATSRRGAPCPFEVRRQASLGRGVQTIATILGCCMEDVARVLNPAEPEQTDKPAPVVRLSDEHQRRTRRKIRDQRLCSMWLAEIPCEEICRELSIGPTTLKADRVRLGLKRRKPGVKSRKDRK